MKVYINKPSNNWISPYSICEKICWWRDVDYDEPWVRRMNKILWPVSDVLFKLLNFLRPEIRYVKIDPWDTWSMDQTLTPIVLPMLKQLKASKMGSPPVADEDVPEHLRSTAAPPKENEWDVDPFWHARWEWVLDQMIWSFEQLGQDWEAQFHGGEWDVYWEKTDSELREMKYGPNHTSYFDSNGYQKHCEKIDNGLRLFGKYYRSLWD